MSSPINILIVDDRPEYLTQIRDKVFRVSRQLGYLDDELNVQLASTYMDAKRTLIEDSNRWDILVTNIALGDPKNDTAKTLGIRLAKVALEKSLQTVVVSGTRDGSIINKLYRQYKIRDLILKGTPRFERRLSECISDFLLEESDNRRSGDDVTAQSEANSSDSANISVVSLPPRRKILFLSASPNQLNPGRLDQEVRDIQNGIERARHRDRLELIPQWAVRPRDFQRAMLEQNPQIVHFSGYGEGNAGLCFEDEEGNFKRVSGPALVSLFRLFSQRGIECVLLNRCYLPSQAQALIECIPHVIGVPQAVTDRFAIDFAVGFYDALGSGESIEFAFEAGRVAIQINNDNPPEALLPVLLRRE
ncbi:MAG: hypothetical protein AAF703_12025 [Cyanobacteria bacterium P01_D01_bin.105]